ncbi:MAG: APC family permease, partial [Haloplanus sp.]
QSERRFSSAAHVGWEVPTVLMETALVIAMVGIRIGLGVAAFTGFNLLGHGGDLSLLTSSNFAPAGFASVLATAALGVWAFIGLEFATPLVEEVKNPSKNIPKGMIIGGVVILIMSVIMGFGTILTYNPFTHHSAYMGNAPQITVSRILFGSAGTWFASLASAAATVGSLLVAYASIQRIVYAMAREGLLPEPLAYVHPKYDSPWVAILTTGVIFLIPVIFSNTVVVLISAAAAVWMMVYLWILGLVLKMRVTHPDLDRPYTAHPIWYVAAIGLILLTLWKAYAGAYYQVAIGCGIFVIGFVYSTLWVRVKKPDATLPDEPAAASDD